MKSALPRNRDFFSTQQIVNGVPAVTEVAINTFHETLEKFHWNQGRVSIYIGVRNSFKEICPQLILD